MSNNCKFQRYEHGPKKGQLVSHAWPGGYPLFYLADGGAVLCPACANNNPEQHPENPLICCDANWEDPAMHCDDCGARIESAYSVESEA